MLGFNLPLTAILLLWINMVTDGAPALAFSVDPYGSDIMQRRPKPAEEDILPKAKLVLITTLGGIGTIFALTLFHYCGGNEHDPHSLRHARTMVFNFVVIYELILVFLIRRGFRVPLLCNRWIWLAIALSLLLQAVLMYTPLAQPFDIVALRPNDLAVLALCGLFFGLIGFAGQRTVAMLFESDEQGNQSP
jgi:Ca2+-transporting ATPase